MALPRGMRDLSGRDLAGMAYVRDAFERMAESYDYTPVQPSPLELMQTLETKSGPAIRDEIYGFTDKGGREVGLRFDFTMGLTRRAASDRSVRLPSKISCFGGVFRYDEPQKNRYRHFHQWDIEIYGRPHPAQDAEIIEFTSKFLDSLPVPHTIRISHRSIMESYITRRLGAGAVDDMLRAADKIQKKSAREIVEEFAAKGYGEADVRDLVEFAGTSGTPDDVGPLVGPEMHSYLDGLVGDLGASGVENAVVDFGIVRGLDYYTGMVFEVYGSKSGEALAGGGRYDALPAAFGRPDVGAAGVAGGVERIVSAMDPDGLPRRPGRVSVVYAGDGMRRGALAMASALRGRGVPTGMDVSGRPLKKQMERARDSVASVIMAPDEMRDGMVILRDMSGGVQRLVPYADMLADPLRFIQGTPG